MCRLVILCIIHFPKHSVKELVMWVELAVSSVTIEMNSVKALFTS